MLLILPRILLNLLTYPTLPNTMPWTVNVTLVTMRALYAVLFFSMLRSSNQTPPSVGEVNLERQLTWVKIRLDESQYRVHSLRHGALQEAVLVEPSLELVGLQGNHVSDATYAYAALPGSRRFCVSQNCLTEELAGCQTIQGCKNGQFLPCVFGLIFLY